MPPQTSSICESDPTRPVQYSLFANAVLGTYLSPRLAVAPGVHFVRLESGGAAVLRRVVYLR